jgi:hypothetical protein
MGGCYLAGVAPESFSSFSARSGLQQSRSFWGVEDGGRCYEGRREGGRRGGGGDEEVMYGSMDVITIVADLTARTLSYWLNGEPLGALVKNLPPGPLYPVATPFNSGVSVVICPLSGDPKAILAEHAKKRELAATLEKSRRQADLLRRKRLLINEDNTLTPKLVETLAEIVGWYEAPPAAGMSAVQAARLWYRSGFKLSKLSMLVPAPAAAAVKAEDFVKVIGDLVKEEESKLLPAAAPAAANPSSPPPAAAADDMEEDDDDDDDDDSDDAPPRPPRLPRRRRRLPRAGLQVLRRRRLRPAPPAVARRRRGGAAGAAAGGRRAAGARERRRTQVVVSPTARAERAGRRERRAPAADASELRASLQLLFCGRSGQNRGLSGGDPPNPPAAGEAALVPARLCGTPPLTHSFIPLGTSPAPCRASAGAWWSRRPCS